MAANITNPVFSEYQTTESDLFEELFSDKLLTCEDRPLEDSSVIILMFATALLQKTCQRLRNGIAPQEWSVLRDVRMVILEIGFIAASVLTPVEIIARLVVGIALLPLAATSYLFSFCFDNEGITKLLWSPFFVGAFLGAVVFPHNLVSSVTHLMYSDRQIDFVGQSKMIFCDLPQEEVQE